MKIRIAVDLNVNRVVKTFVWVDLALLAGWGLIEPILSVYVIQNVVGATLITVGISAAVYWIFRSLLGLPISKLLDKNPGEEDDLRMLIGGLLVAAFSAFSFVFVTHVWQLYLVQAVHALAFAAYASSWPAIFSRHLDKDKVSFDWALDSTVAGLSAGVSGFFGGVIANRFGYQSVFLLAAFFSLVAAFVLLMAPDLVLPRKTPGEPVMKDHTPTNLGR